MAANSLVNQSHYIGFPLKRLCVTSLAQLLARQSGMMGTRQFYPGHWGSGDHWLAYTVQVGLKRPFPLITRIHQILQGLIIWHFEQWWVAGKVWTWLGKDIVVVGWLAVSMASQQFLVIYQSCSSSIISSMSVFFFEFPRQLWLCRTCLHSCWQRGWFPRGWHACKNK